jgi:hypothetical protein
MLVHGDTLLPFCNAEFGPQGEADHVSSSQGSNAQGARDATELGLGCDLSLSSLAATPPLALDPLPRPETWPILFGASEVAICNSEACGGQCCFSCCNRDPMIDCQATKLYYRNDSLVMSTTMIDTGTVHLVPLVLQ